MLCRLLLFVSIIVSPAFGIPIFSNSVEKTEEDLVRDSLECLPNSSFTNCSSLCEPKCGQAANGMCPAGCGQPKCECHKGFQRNIEGQCVHPDECVPNIGMPAKTSPNLPDRPLSSTSKQSEAKVPEVTSPKVDRLAAEESLSSTSKQPEPDDPEVSSTKADRPAAEPVSSTSKQPEADIQKVASPKAEDLLAEPLSSTSKQSGPEVPKVDVFDEKGPDGSDIKMVQISSQNMGNHTITVGENSIKIQSKTVF